MRNVVLDLVRHSLLLFIFSLLFGCAVNPVTGNREVVLLSEGQEIQLGARSHQALITREYPVYNDPQLQRMVDSIGQELAERSHRSHLEYTFTLLDSPQVNAFALPGGFVYITRGIMAYMNSEEELAGVLGHELGHVTARHGVRSHRNQSVVGILGQVLNAKYNNQLIDQAFAVSGNAWVKGYGRGLELEADRLGAEYLARAGYDPNKMIEVVGILKDQELYEIQRAKEEGREPRVYHGLFSTHPANDDRLQEVINAASNLNLPISKQTDASEFVRALDGMAYGDSEEQGIIRGNRFYHKPLNFKLTMPEGWLLQNSPTALAAINQERSSVIVLQGVTSAEGLTPTGYLQKEAPEITDIRRVGRAYFGSIVQTRQSGQQIPMTLAAIENDGSMYLFVSYGKQGPPNDLLAKVTASVDTLSEADRKIASGQKIKVIRARASDTFASLARQYDLGKYSEEQLRLLNGMYPEGEPEVGQYIKVVE